MPVRDDSFCYELVVAAAQIIGDVKPTYEQLIFIIRKGHKRVGKRMPSMKYLRMAIRRFNKGGQHLIARDGRGR